MKKIFSILAVSTLLFACTSEPKEEKAGSNIFIEQKVQEFIKSNPDWDKDETTKNETTDKFQRQVIKWSNETTFLNQMPLQLQDLRDTTVSGADLKIGTFTAYNDTTRPMNSILNYIQVKIDALMPADLAKTLEPKKRYHIHASLYKQGKRADVKYISVAEFKGYDLGKYLFSLAEAKPIQ